MIEFEPYIGTKVAVLLNGDDVGLLAGTLFSDGRINYVFEPDGVDGDQLGADDLRTIADKLDELNGAASD